MEVLSTQSLENLRIEANKNPQIISMEINDLLDEFSLSLVPFRKDLPELLFLEFPDGNTQGTNKDLENCKLIFRCLSELTPAEATDERFWTTLCFGHYADYCRLRWPLEKAKNPVNHVAEHWFAGTIRDRMRNNAISRLWWMASIANRIPDAEIDDVLKILFFNSDYRSNLLERNSSSNSINVVSSILSISQKSFDQGVSFNREKFRTFMKKVDFIGKRTSLPSLSVHDLEELLTPVYAEAYDIKKKKRGFMGVFSS